MYTIGIDEAGRGPLSGSVFAAAVILNANNTIIGIADSKKLSAKKREHLAVLIKRDALAWSIAYSTVEEIDTLNILQATLLAMRRAVAGLPDIYIQNNNVMAMVDGNQNPLLTLPTTLIVQGDSKVIEISAASILAKVAKDAESEIAHQLYPQYGFNQHKGYGTPQHLYALKQHGATPLHRRSFAPVARCYENNLINVSHINNVHRIEYNV